MTTDSAGRPKDVAVAAKPSPFDTTMNDSTRIHSDKTTPAETPKQSEPELSWLQKAELWIGAKVFWLLIAAAACAIGYVVIRYWSSIAGAGGMVLKLVLRVIPWL